MLRIFTLIAFCFALSAHAGDKPGPCQGDECQAPQPQPVPPPPQESNGFCDGLYDGFLANQPGPLALEIHTVGDCGQIEVTGHWAGATWIGRGVCQQVSPNQATVVFQYPNTPMQRGLLTVARDGQAELDGAVDGGDSFRLMRHAQ